MTSSSAPFEILDHAVIVRQEGRYIGWPTIARTPDNQLVAAFSGDRDAHVCPRGKSLIIRSTNSGQSWSAPEWVNNFPLDDRDTGLCITRKGVYLISWFTAYYDPLKRPATTPPLFPKPWEQAGQPGPSPAEIDQWAYCRFPGEVWRGRWIRRSLDGGKTWGDPIRVDPTAPHGPIELHDGRLLFIGNDGYDRTNKTTGLAIMESRDVGVTWNRLATVSMFPTPPLPPGEFCYLGEPHAVEASPGHIVAFARFEIKPYVESRPVGYLWQFDSWDGGRTWTEPSPTPILGKPPHLLKLADGRLLVTYGFRHPPYGQRACLSADEGRTWDTAHEIVLRDDAPSSDLGYPSTAQCADGTLVTVYYQQESAGEMTRLMATRWRLRD